MMVMMMMVMMMVNNDGLLMMTMMVVVMVMVTVMMMMVMMMNRLMISLPLQPPQGKLQVQPRHAGRALHHSESATDRRMICFKGFRSLSWNWSCHAMKPGSISWGELLEEQVEILGRFHGDFMRI